MNPAEKKQPLHSADFGFDFQDLLHTTFSKLWLIALCVLIMIFAGLLYISTATPIFEAVATIQVEQAEQKIVKIDDITSEDLKQTEILKTMEQKLQRRSLIQRVVRRLNLTTHKSFEPMFEKNTKEKPEDVLVRYLEDCISVGLRRGTRLIDVMVQLPDRKLVKEIANTLVDEFTKETTETRSDTSQSAHHFLLEEAERLKTKLSTSELALQRYNTVIQLKERILEQEKEIDTLAQRYLEKHPKMIQARNLLGELQSNFLAEMSKIPYTQATEETLATPEESNQEEKFKTELRRAESRFNVLKRDVETDRGLYESILQRLKETTITKELEPVQIRIVEKAFMPDKPVKPQKLLVMALSVIGGLFLSVIMVFIVHAMDSSLKTVDAVEQYLDLPVLGAIPEIKADDVLRANPSTPQGLRRRFHRILESLSWNKEIYTPTFQSALGDFFDSLKQNLRASLNLPLQSGEGPKIIEGSSASYPLVLIQSPESTASEAVRTLRVNFSLLGKEDALRTFLFTSAVPFEGKSFTAANFAVALAQQNYKTLIIDADLRRPTIHNYFDKKHGWQGLSDYLLGKHKLAEVALSTSLPNLHVITAGTPCPNPAELLSSGGFSELLDEASKIFDRIVIDSAPVTPVSDTLMLASKAQYVSLVIYASQTPRRPIKRACLLLENAKANLVGVVLNRMPISSGFGYDPYYYHYHRGEGYGKSYGQSYRSI
ncbi:MAG: GumC family protein [Verrucomicrobiota bacterium]